jgi:hypothetical protein
MKNDQERQEDQKAGDHATPNPPVTPRLCLIFLGHEAILLPVCPGAKRKCQAPIFLPRALSSGGKQTRLSA